MWWHTPLIPVLGMQRQADIYEFEDSLVCRDSSRTTRKDTRKPSLKTKQNQAEHPGYMVHAYNLVFMELGFQQRQTITEFPSKCSADGPGCDTKQNPGSLMRFMLVLSLTKPLRIQKDHDSRQAWLIKSEDTWNKLAHISPFTRPHLFFLCSLQYSLDVSLWRS